MTLGESIVASGTIMAGYRKFARQKPLDPMFATRVDSFSPSASPGARVWRQGLKFLAVTVQLVLVLLVIHIFKFEDGNGLQRLLPLVLGGFVVHAWLPMNLRLPFFVSLAFAAIWLLLGLVPGSLLIGSGLGLIGLCHIPAAKWIRVAMIVVAGVMLTVLRAHLFVGPWSRTVIPVLGSMFMFRLALYLYDVDNEKRKATLWERLAYFFMLPNTFFPLFPIIDYVQFRRSHYNTDPITIYQKGVFWMLRGAVHLTLYRAVYHYFTPSMEEVAGLGGVTLFVAGACLLYLRVSGLFHLIVGMLCLFGFNLPETHRRYLLASSFTDYWRRINIYWKDFVMKMFFFPLFMRLRRFGANGALVSSTLAVFAFTWLLHAYMRFWLQGEFLLKWVDGAFWMTLGVLTAINLMWEMHSTRVKRLKCSGFDLGDAIILGVKRMSMLVFLSLMWSFWSSESAAEWWSVLGIAGDSGVRSWMKLSAILTALWSSFVGLEWLKSRNITLFFDERNMGFAAAASRTSSLALMMVLLGTAPVQSRLGSMAGGVLASLREPRLNARDAVLEEREYSENRLANGHFTIGFFGAWSQKPDDWADLNETDAVAPRSDERLWELLPDKDVAFRGVRLHTNRWGMRDRDYAMMKPAGAFRLAVMGASYTMGAGVADHETFEALIEERLNEHAVASSDARYELLNFSVGGYGLAQQVAVAHEQVFDFEPDAVLYVAQPEEVRRTIERLMPALLAGYELRSPFLREMLNRIGYHAGMDRTELRKRLGAVGRELVEWGYGELARLSGEHGAVPVLVMLPGTSRPFMDEETDYLCELARKFGFEIVDLQGVYAGHDLEEIRVAPWDLHPNAVGHRLIADRLYRWVTSHGAWGMGHESSVIGQASIGITGKMSKSPRRSSIPNPQSQ